VTISDLKTEERKQKLSRYRKKKIKRNFGRKIKVLVLGHCKQTKTINLHSLYAYQPDAEGC
jgi:hypothetical protein